MKCFNCGTEGHVASSCQWRRELRDHDPLGIYRRAASEIAADPHGWADKIRAAMGWVKAHAGETKAWDDQKIAARQVAESRAARQAAPDQWVRLP